MLPSTVLCSGRIQVCAERPPCPGRWGAWKASRRLQGGNHKLWSLPKMDGVAMVRDSLRGNERLTFTKCLVNAGHCLFYIILCLGIWSYNHTSPKKYILFDHPHVLIEGTVSAVGRGHLWRDFDAIKHPRDDKPHVGTLVSNFVPVLLVSVNLCFTCHCRERPGYHIYFYFNWNHFTYNII